MIKEAEICRNCRGRGYMMVLGYRFNCPKRQRYFINQRGEIDSEYVPDLRRKSSG